MLVCKKCVMDESDPNITFDSEGVCNHCHSADQVKANFSFPVNDHTKLDELMASLKTVRGPYDCLLGLSGGVDSSYIALLAKKYGLNPLCLHFDNGWNSVIAVKNIKRIIDATGWDFQTVVINWPEFKSLQRAYLKAGVIDIEVCTDHAIFASMFDIAKKEGIKNVLSGTNFATEHGMPIAWTWHKLDRVNLKAINKKFGDRPLLEYPNTNTLKWLFIRKFGLGLKFLEPLNAINYNKNQVIDELKSEFGWESYGEKHHESAFTKFYQNYILPKKFNVDKRKLHLSALIRMGQMTREEAVKALQEKLYEHEALSKDKNYVLKKLAFSEEEFDELMKQDPVPHDAYASDRLYIDLLLKLAKFIGVKRFYE